MGVCSAGNCSNSSTKGYVVCRFPKESERREVWRKLVAESRDQPDWQPTDGSRLCEAHFEPRQWKKYRTALKEDAVPVKFCSCDGQRKKEKDKPKVEHSDHTYACNSSKKYHEPLELTEMEPFFDL